MTTHPYPVANFWNSFATSLPQWRDRAFASGLSEIRDTWGDYESRILRYDVYGAMYEGTVFRELNLWAKSLKVSRDLYEHIRAIRSPSKRIGDFWATHTYSGPLDLDAGDGKARPSAIPIETKNEKIRPLIAQVFRDSMLQTNKDIYSLQGGTLGDVFLHAVDDPIKRRAYTVVRSPRTVYDVIKDHRGNIRGYRIVELRPDPRGTGLATASPSVNPWVTFTEVCWRGDGQTVHFRTYLDGMPFDWDANTEHTEEAPGDSHWTQDYGFIPMVHVQNRDVGKGWGWSVYHGSEDKLLEVDDVASKVNDEIRRQVDPKFYGPGIDPESLKIASTADGRDDLGILGGPVNTSLTPMVGNLDVADASAHLKSLDVVIVADFPELVAEDVSPDSSGEARKVAQEKVVSAVDSHRAIYDAGLVAAIKHAMSIAILKGYVLGFPADAYEQGLLDFSIGKRPVFAVGEQDDLDRRVKQSGIIKTLVDSGVPWDEAMIEAGIPVEAVDRIRATKARADAATTDRLNAQQAADMQAGGGGIQP